MYMDGYVEGLDSQLDGDTRQFWLTADGRPHTDRCAIGQCLSGFSVLQRTLQSDVCQLTCIPCDASDIFFING